MKIRNIKPTFLRLLVLVGVGFPCLFKWPLTLVVAKQDSFAFLGIWMTYCAFTSVIIIREVGAEQWAKWFAGACVLAIATTGPSFISLEVWESLKKLGFAFDKQEWTWKTLQQGLTMITVVPYAVFMVNCFSVSRAVQRASTWLGGRRTFAKRSLIILRVSQHALEVLPPLVLVWKEEHPKLILPRFRKDLSGPVETAYSCVKWFFGSVWIWVKAGLVFTIEPMATFCAEIDAHFPES